IGAGSVGPAVRAARTPSYFISHASSRLGSYAVTPSGAVYFSYYGSLSAPAPHWSLRGNISSPSPIMHIGDAQTDVSGQVVVHAFAENGNFYVSTDDGKTWGLHGNVFGGATPALNESWGQLKARYAPNRGTTTQPRPQPVVRPTGRPALVARAVPQARSN